jgi:arylsulfatase A-like enzyme
MIPARTLVGTHDIVFVTLDTLRFDVAERAHRAGRTPNLAALFPGGWSRRHTPGSFTYAAHHAFFAGFLPTPSEPGRHPRLFAAAFEGSETTAAQTWTFPEADLPTALANAGYHTACIGGVGFFNKQTALGRVLPGLFRESHWAPEMGVTSARSTAEQVACAVAILERTESRVFLFMNVSAIHQPNRIFSPGAATDTVETHEAALAYVDTQLPPLIAAVQRRGPSLWIVCSDHGTAYGEEGHHGHRVGDPSVWTVPYGERVLEAAR